MPVADRQPGQHYGCHNRKPYATGYMAPDRVYRPDGTYHIILRRIPLRNSALCKYDMWHSDYGCEGCKWAGGQVPSAKELFVDSVDTSKKCVDKTEKNIHEECND